MDLGGTEPRERAFAAPPATGLAFLAGFFFSFRAIFTLSAVRGLGWDARTGTALGIALECLLLLLVCFQSFGCAVRTFGSMLRLRSVQLVMAFVLFSCCSLAWSETASLPASLAYWCGMACDAAIVILLLRAGPAAEVSNAMMEGFVWSCCVIALIAWILPAQPDLRLGDEEYFNTNQIANLCALSIFLAQLLARRRGGKWGWVTLLLALTLVRSLSKTTIVAFLVSGSFLLIQDRSMSRKSRAMLFAAAVAAVFAFWGLFEAYFDIYTTAGNQAETLTGRTGIWAYVLDAALDKPWLGHGFDSMWKVIPPFGPDRFEARHAENEVLQQFYAYGAVGIAVLAGLYASLWRQFRRIGQGPVRILCLSLLLYVMVRGLAEAEPFDLLFPVWLILLLSLLAEDARSADRDIAVTSPTDATGKAMRARPRPLPAFPAR